MTLQEWSRGSSANVGKDAMNASGERDRFGQGAAGRLLHEALFVVLVVLVVVQVLAPALREETFGFSFDPERGLTVRDFPAGLVMARAIWTGQPKSEGGPRPGPGYDLDSHLAVTRQWVGQPVDAAMPFPQSPTMLWLLAPFCPLPLVWAFVAWTVLNLAVVWWLLRPSRSPWLIGPLFFLSPLSIAGFALGQMAFLGTAGVVFLAEQTRKPSGQSWRAAWPSVLVLWALTARPPLALTAMVALLAVGRWRSVLGAVLLTAASTAALTPWLGTIWASDYLRLLGQFNREQAPAAFAWVLNLTQMNNLRSFLNVELGVRDDLASQLCSGLWLFALGALLLLCRLRARPAALVWALCLVLQMLLCPHMHSYELILLYAVLLSFLQVVTLPEAVRRATAWAFPVLPWLTPSWGLFQGRRPSLVFAILLVLAAWFVWLLLRPARPKSNVADNLAEKAPAPAR
jgi:hypothetical protein